MSEVREPSWIQEEDNLLLSLLEFDDQSNAKIGQGIWIEIAGVMNTQAPAAGIYLRTLTNLNVCIRWAYLRGWKKQRKAGEVALSSSTMITTSSDTNEPPAFSTEGASSLITLVRLALNLQPSQTVARHVNKSDLPSVSASSSDAVQRLRASFGQLFKRSWDPETQATGSSEKPKQSNSEWGRDKKIGKGRGKIPSKPI